MSHISLYVFADLTHSCKTTMVRYGRNTNVGRDCLFFAGSRIMSRFLFGMIFTWNSEDMSLFECKRSDSVLFNVTLITRGTTFYSTKCATVNTLPLYWYLEGSVLGRENVPKCSAHAYKLQLTIHITQQNISSNYVVVTQNNTHHISNSQKTAKSHDRESYIWVKNTCLG